MNDATLGGLLGIVILLLGVWVYDRFSVTASSCTGDCNQGRNCTCKGD